MSLSLSLCLSPHSVKRRKCAQSSGGGGKVGGATTEKHSKGLRHFSQLVCEKVREKGRTTYNEVR